MGAFPNLKPSYTILPLLSLWSSIPFSFNYPFALQTSGIPNHVVWATCPHSQSRSTEYTKPRSHTQPINCNIIPQKDIMIPYMDQTRHPLKSQVLAKFFPSATIPVTLHYSEFADKYSPQYGRLS